MPVSKMLVCCIAAAFSFFFNVLVAAIPGDPEIVLIDSLNKRGYYYLSVNNDSAEYFTDRAFQLSIGHGYQRGEMDALLNRAYIFAYRGEYEKSIFLAIATLPRIIRLGYKDLESWNYYLIGESYREVGQYSRAAEYFLEALELDLASKDDWKIAFDYNTLSYLCLEIGGLEMGKAYLDSARHIYSGMDDAYANGMTFLSLGDYFNRVNQLDSALASLDMAEKLLTGHKDKYLLGHLFLYRAEAYLRSGKPNQADSVFKYYQQALDLTKDDDILDVRILSLIGLAKAEIKFGSSEMAIEKLDESIVLAEKSKSYKQLKEAWNIKVDYFRSINAFVQLIEAQDSLNSVFIRVSQASFQSVGGNFEGLAYLFENKRRIAKVSMEMVDLKKSQRRFWLTGSTIFALFSILLLFIVRLYLRSKNSVVEIARQKDQIEGQRVKMSSLLDFQKGITKIISHDMRSPLNNVRVLLEILFMGLKRDLDKESLHIYGKVNYSLEQVSHLLDDLAARLYLEDHQKQEMVEEVNLEQVVKDSKALFVQMVEEKKLHIETDIDPDVCLNVQPLLFNTVVRNLIFNAIKFSNQGGYVWVEAGQSDEEVKVTVRDNGRGMSEELVSNIRNAGSVKSTNGTFGEKGIGLGLQIVSEILALFETSLVIESIQGEGSSFSFSLPKTKKAGVTPA